MIKKGTLTFPISDCFIGFDAEWTKNYKIKNGNVPFCFSIVSVCKQDIDIIKLKEGDIKFKYVQFYCQYKEETNELIKLSNINAEHILSALNSSTLCGHQVSSDFSVLYNLGKANSLKELSNIKKLQETWHKRRNQQFPQIVDTRYDVEQVFMGKSRRLVDMCNDFLLDVSQPELRKSSMTKLQNDFYECGDNTLYERIAVMNLRHSLCAIVLCWLNKMVNEGLQITPVNINKTVFKVLQNDFNWITSTEFLKLL